MSPMGLGQGKYVGVCNLEAPLLMHYIGGHRDRGLPHESIVMWERPK